MRAGAEEAKPQRTVKAFAQLDQPDAQLGSFAGEAIGVAFGDAFDQAVEAKFAYIVAELSQGVILGFEILGIQDCLMQLSGGPFAEVAAGSLHQEFQQSHQPGVFQFDAGDFGFALDDRLGQAGQDIKLAMHVEQLGLGIGEAVGDLLEAFSHGLPMGQRFLEVKILEVVADDLLAEKGSGLFVLFEEGVFEIGPEDVLAMVEAFDDVLPLAGDALAAALAKEAGDAVGGQKIKSQFAGALEEGADGPMTFEDEIAAVFDLAHGVKAMEAVASQAFRRGKLRPHDEGPIVDSLLEDFGVQPVGRFLQGGGIGHRDKAIVVFDKRDFLAEQFPLDEVMAVEIGGDPEGQEGADAQDHGAGHFIQDVKIIMGETAAMLAHKLEVRILGGVFGWKDSERPALLHALEDVVNAEAILAGPALLPGPNQVLLALTLLRPLQGQVVIAGISGYPSLISAGSLHQNLLGDFRLVADLAEKPGPIDFAGEVGEITVDDDAVEAVIKPLQMRGKELKKELHGRPFLGFVFGHSNSRKSPHATQAPEQAQPFY